LKAKRRTDGNLEQVKQVVFDKVFHDCERLGSEGDNSEKSEPETLDSSTPGREEEETDGEDNPDASAGTGRKQIGLTALQMDLERNPNQWLCLKMMRRKYSECCVSKTRDEF
jgi:hypothetical protein